MKYDHRFPLLQADRLPNLLPLQDACLQIAQGRYLQPGETPDGLRRRVAKALAAQESKVSDWEETFYRVLHYAYPSSRILATAGVIHPTRGTGTVDWVTSRAVGDSIDEILHLAREAAMTRRSGVGISYDFSMLRPMGSLVDGLGASYPGSIPVMKLFDALNESVSGKANRIASQAAAIAIHHPDIEAIIDAHRSDAGIRRFKLSVLVTEEFLTALLNNWDFPLYFPASPAQLRGDQEVIWRPWPLRKPHYSLSDQSEVACWVYRKVRARDLWAKILQSSYERSDLSLVCIDEANTTNPLWWMETLRAPHPGGNQLLPPNGACPEGSINLAALVQEPFSPRARFDWKLYAEIIRIFSRTLDNVVDLNALPLSAHRQELVHKRRHGMGYMGLASAMTMLGIRYGSESSIKFTRDVTRMLAIESWRAGLELAKEKGSAPALSAYYELTPEMIRQQPQLQLDGFKQGQRLLGSVLHARYSSHMQRIASADPSLVRALIVTGSRFTHATTIAPTGGVSSGIANNVSNGIEPTFAHRHTHYLASAGAESNRPFPVLSYELQAYQTLIDPSFDPDFQSVPFDGSCVTLDPLVHVDIQAAAQEWIDSSVAKTISVPANYPFEYFKTLYSHAIDQSLKGCSTYRFDPKVTGSDVADVSDPATTTYELRLPDGTSMAIGASGDHAVGGETQRYTAADLFDALKAGAFGGCS